MSKPFVAVVILSTAGAACGVAEEPPLAEQASALRSVPDRRQLTPHEPLVSRPPAALRCVSQPSQLSGETALHVDRLTVGFSGASATVTAERGLLFQSHSGTVSTEGVTTSGPQQATVSVGANVNLTEGGTDPHVITLHRSGLLWLGSLDAAPLTCWNDLELFGSPWTGLGGALTAHFNWGTGKCTGPNGAEALNALPVEVVRETRQGECVDLSGAELSSGDLTNPDLTGWYLSGAHLDGAHLHFANLTEATLNGALLGKLDFGYATVQGAVDSNTVLPSSGCETKSNPWSGDIVTCSQ
jgi:hypothetical protein